MSSPVDVTTLQSDGPHYELADIEAELAKSGIPVEGPAAAFDGSPPPVDIDGLVADLLDVAEFRNIWEWTAEGPTSERFPSNSERDYALARLVTDPRGADLPDAEACAILRACLRHHGDPKGKARRPDYVPSTVTKARATHVASETGSSDRPTVGLVASPNGAAPERTARMVVEPWGAFRDHTPEHIAWHVDDLIAEGSLTFYAGPPKGGKTWLGLELAQALVTAKAYLGRFTIPRSVPVLYIALEGNRSNVRTRVGAMARGRGIDPDGSDALGMLHIAYRPTGLDLSDPTWTDELAAQVAATGARVVIIDVLRAAAPQLRESGEGAGDFARILANLAPLLAEGVSIVVLHHFIKPGDTSRQRSMGERMTGSGALFGAADLVLGITGGETRAMRVETVGRNEATPEPFGVQLDGEGNGPFGGFTYRDALRLVANDTPPPAAGTRQQKASAADIGAFVRAQSNRDATPKMIREHFAISDGTLIARRDELEKIGVKYQSAGRLSVYYDATPQPSPQPSITGVEG